VYPAGEGLSQAFLRKAIANALTRVDWRDTLAPELLMALKGKFRTAFRRLKKSAPAHIEGVHFSCYYYNPGYVIKALKKEFDVVTLKGVCITVPPEFYQGFVERYPQWFARLKKTDAAIGTHFPFNRCCDHYLITLQKK